MGLFSSYGLKALPWTWLYLSALVFVVEASWYPFKKLILNNVRRKRLSLAVLCTQINWLSAVRNPKKSNYRSWVFSSVFKWWFFWRCCKNECSSLHNDIRNMTQVFVHLALQETYGHCKNLDRTVLQKKKRIKREKKDIQITTNN